MMKPALEPYLEYRVAGGLGGIPAHWSDRQLGRLGRLFKGNGGTKADEVAAGIPCIRYGDIYTQYDFFAWSTRSSVSTERAIDYTPIQYGDVLFAASGETIEEIGKSAANLMESRACCGGDVIVFRPSIETDARFMGYAADCRISRFQKSQMGRGMTVMHIYGNELKSLWIALPPLDEQHSIADFLDLETERIDALVTKKRRLIELLQEKRTALISHAVTKGLDPDVPMKESGVEWLGRIPAAWQMRRLKQVTEFVTSGSRGWAEYYSDDGPVFIRITNLNRKSIDLDLSQIQHVRPPAGSEGERTRVTSGDVLVSITADIGTVGLVPDGLGEAYVNQHTALTRPRKHLVEPRWLALCLHSGVGQRQFPILLQGGTKVGLNLDDVRNLLVVLPPLTEQLRLMSAVDDNAKKLADLSASAQAATARLQEYRSALITAAVTGQIDVRGR